MTYGDMRRTYDREVYGLETLVDSGACGFCTWKLTPDSLYVDSVYVMRMHRGLGVARRMLELLKEIARLNGVQQIVGVVDSRTTVWRQSLAMQEALGFELSHTEGPLGFLVLRLDPVCDVGLDGSLVGGPAIVTGDPPQVLVGGHQEPRGDDLGDGPVDGVEEF